MRDLIVLTRRDSLFIETFFASGRRAGKFGLCIGHSAISGNCSCIAAIDQGQDLAFFHVVAETLVHLQYGSRDMCGKGRFAVRCSDDCRRSKNVSGKVARRNLLDVDAHDLEV